MDLENRTSITVIKNILKTFQPENGQKLTSASLNRNLPVLIMKKSAIQISGSEIVSDL